MSFVNKEQRKALEEKVDVEPAHQEQERANRQAEVAKGENAEFPRPGFTMSSMPVQQAPISSPLQQMASPRPTRNLRLPKRFDDYDGGM